MALKKLRVKNGYTILEAAVVLTIIGLLIGSIIVGQTLIRSAKMYAVSMDIGIYLGAVKDFQDKYKALPGDMPDAENFWGSDTTCPATPFTASPHVPTCNGDGNGFIDGTTEPFRAWQQLANSGFISGAYTGVAGSAGANQHVRGINSPKTMLDGGGFDLFYIGNMSGDVNYYGGYYPLKLGLGTATATGAFDKPLFTPGEALAIDSKLDDGAPGTGNIMAFKSPINPGCATTDVSTTAVYAISGTNFLCSLNIIIPDPFK